MLGSLVRTMEGQPDTEWECVRTARTTCTSASVLVLFSQYVLFVFRTRYNQVQFTVKWQYTGSEAILPVLLLVQRLISVYSILFFLNVYSHIKNRQCRTPKTWQTAVLANLKVRLVSFVFFLWWGRGVLRKTHKPCLRVESPRGTLRNMKQDCSRWL